MFTFCIFSLLVECPIQSNPMKLECDGSLNIAHIDDFDNEKDFDLDGYRNSYLNIKRGFPILKRNYMIRMESFGDCCWELFSETKFKGDKQVLFPGGFAYPDFQANSIKRVNCPLSYLRQLFFGK